VVWPEFWEGNGGRSQTLRYFSVSTKEDGSGVKICALSAWSGHHCLVLVLDSSGFRIPSSIAHLDCASRPEAS